MPRIIPVEDGHVSSLDECFDSLQREGFDPNDEASLMHGARALRRLGNNRDFLGDMLVAELAARHREEVEGNNYGAPVLMLTPAGQSNFFLRAAMWPSPSEHALRASGNACFVYEKPHDHNFDFLTIGYFGPGYTSDYYEYDYEAVVGWRGEPVDLRFVETARLDPGKIMHYRAHIDVHTQHPPESLSVSLNIMHANGAQAWLDQYAFDCDRKTVQAQLAQGASEAFLSVAVGLGGDSAGDLAETFAWQHPSDRMRLSAWSALASIADGPAGRDAVWRRAEAAGSRLVAHEARLRREALAA
jgi:hypothetical protein